MIKNAGTTPVTHFTVIKNTKEGIKEQLDQYLAEGVDHILASPWRYSAGRDHYLW